MNSTTQFPVPKFIWESLESAIKAESRRLVREIAQTLKKDEGVLWKEISKEPFSAYLVDMTEPTEENFQCKAYNLEGPVQKICRQPTLYGKAYCPHHCQSLLSKPSSFLPKYRIVKYFDEDLDGEKEAYLNQATNEVFEKETLELIGIWDSEEQRLDIFEKGLNQISKE